MKGQEENAEQREDLQVDPIHRDGGGDVAVLLKPAGLVGTPSHQVYAQHEPEVQSLDPQDDPRINPGKKRRLDQLLSNKHISNDVFA